MGLGDRGGSLRCPVDTSPADRGQPVGPLYDAAGRRAVTCFTVRQDLSGYVAASVLDEAREAVDERRVSRPYDFVFLDARECRATIAMLLEQKF